jgi:hypothetical protein
VIRLGAVLKSNHPELIRHFPGFLAQEDAVQMIDKCLSAPPEVRFGIFDAISENSKRWRDTSPRRRCSAGGRPGHRTASTSQSSPGSRREHRRR